MLTRPFRKNSGLRHLQMVAAHSSSGVLLSQISPSLLLLQHFSNTEPRLKLQVPCLAAAMQIMRTIIATINEPETVNSSTGEIKNRKLRMAAATVKTLSSRMGSKMPLPIGPERKCGFAVITVFQLQLASDTAISAVGDSSPNLEKVLSRWMELGSPPQLE